jgi:hypothetical protein
VAGPPAPGRAARLMRGSAMAMRRPGSWLPAAVLLVLVVAALASGCGDSNTVTGTPVPTDVGVINMVAPGACVPNPCVGVVLANVQLVGPLALTPFTLSFGVTSIFPFMTPGAYLLTGATFQDSANNTQGCPDARLTVAVGRTTTVTFTITNDVCAVTVAGPA